MNKTTLRNVLLLIIGSVILACALYIFNIWLLSSQPRVTPTNASFIEGIMLIIFGALFLLGSGGISPASRKAALLAATTEAVSGRKMVGPAELFRREAWKPKGYTRLGLTLIISGIILLVIYFVSL
jgi:hypothetical protein